MSKSKVSVCFIVRNDADSGLLEECFASVRPHVEEIVIVDTGSTDNTPEIAKRYADIFEVFTECNEDQENGPIADFSKARNRSFDLATQPWVMWMDSDDLLAGGENLAKLVEIGNLNKGDRDWCYLFPYEYVYDPTGKCVCLHYRERLLSRRSAMRWVNPVHEVLIPTDDARLHLIPCDDVVFKHQRQRSKKAQEGGRNLRILQKLVEKEGSDDARQFYYLGLEYANAGNLPKATEWLSRYVGVSGWDDEKTMAALKLSEIAYAQKHYQEGIVWAFRAVETRESWGEGYFALARGFFHLAVTGVADVRRNWEKCAHFSRMGLALPPTRTMLFVNPQERALDVHVYLTMALSQLGDARGALTHANEAFKVTPEDPNLVYNKRVFEKIVAKDDAKEALDRLVVAQGMDPETRDQILSVLRGDDGTTIVGGWPTFPRPEGYPKNVEAHHLPVARKTPHARAFGIPEETDIDDLPVGMTDAQVEAATILVWKELVLHDELLAAERFLAGAPYRAKHTPTVEKALERTRGMMRWMDDPKWEQKVNTPEDPTIENGNALPGPLEGALGERSKLALQNVVVGEKILDLGCFDGGIVNRWAMSGLDVTGVDLCEGSIALARKKAAEFKTGAKFVCAKFDSLPFTLNAAFDVVTCCDTYEHVRDHVTDLIVPARKALKPHGRMIVVTPHGSWMRGKFVSWAHPWRWGPDENKPWNCDLPHAHLVAPTPWTVAENFRKDGWYVKDSYVVESGPIRDVEGQGNVYTEARLVHPVCEEPLDVVFACGDAWEAWNPLVHKTKGIGGSETMVVEMAKRLATMGHRVRVFTSTGKYGEGIFDGVEYRQTGHLELVKSCDVYVAWRNAGLLQHPIEAKLKLLWVHDIWAGNATHRNLLKADRILALSQWHKDFMIGHHNLAPEHVRVTRNGIDLTRFYQEAGPRNPKKVVYSSSPDRGLPVLLKVWPEIRKRVPDAELHVFYGFFNWKMAAQARGDENQLRMISQLEMQMQELASQGVVYRDKVDQLTLAREFLTAGVWAHPTWFTETSCAHPDTRISIPGDHRGGPPTARIADLVGKSGFPVYAFNERENRFQIATCNKVWQTKIADELVAIELDSGETLRLTPDHRVLTFDGEWVEAGTLVPGDSLRALHYRYNVAIRDANGRWADESRLVGEWLEGRRLRRDEHVDHEDAQRLDNRPAMLHVMTARDHASKTHRGRKQSRLHEAKRTQAWKEWAKDPANNSKLHERLAANGIKAQQAIRNMTDEERAIFYASRSATRKKNHEERMKDPAYAAKFLKQAQTAGKRGADARWGKNHKVLRVTRIPGGPVFDMEVEGLHNFVADGVVIHNCLTAMEAQAAGLRIVTSSIAALNETVGKEYGTLIDGDWMSDEYQQKFIAEVEDALTASENGDRDSVQERARRDFGLDQLADDWGSMFREEMQRLDTQPLVPYKGRADFVREAA